MGSTKYNILFMKDDGIVKRYRMSPLTLRMMFWFVVLLAVCAGVGAWAGYTFWVDNTHLRQDKIALHKKLNEASVQLESLENVNKILDSYDPNELQALLAAVPLEEKRVEAAEPVIDLRSLLYYKNLMRVAIENIKLRKSGGSLALSFDLNNLQTSSALSGYAMVELIKNNGGTAVLNIDRNDMSFQIQRFKVMRTRFVIPSGLNLKDIYGIRIMLSSNNDELIFSEVYPLSRVLN